MRQAAFFDIDGTIFRDQLMIEHFKKMVKENLADHQVWEKEVRPIYEQWGKRFLNFEDYFNHLIAIYLRELIGEPGLKVSQVAEEVVKMHGDMVYSFARKQIQWHKELGHALFFISGSPDFLVAPMAEKYEADDWRGTTFLMDEDQKLTGEVIPMWDAESKRQAVAELEKVYGIDLSQSYAYGDTMGDWGMLELVGHPVALNPNREFLVAIKNHTGLLERTTVVIERKDVVYVADGHIRLLEAGGSLFE